MLFSEFNYLYSLNILGNSCCYIPSYIPTILQRIPNLYILEGEEISKDDSRRTDAINDLLILQLSINIIGGSKFPGDKQVEEDPKKKSKNRE